MNREHKIKINQKVYARGRNGLMRVAKLIVSEGQRLSENNVSIDVVYLEVENTKGYTRSCFIEVMKTLPEEKISVGKGQNYLLVGDNAIWLKKIPDNSIEGILS